MGKYIYLEFLFPIKDYLATLKGREAIFDWLFPAVITFLVYLLILRGSQYTNEIEQLNGYIISLIGILIGFSITSITLLVTSSSSNIEELQKRETTNRKMSGQKISLYQLILINFTFVLLMEVFTLAINLVYALIDAVNASATNYWISFYVINVFLFSHIILISIRNTTNIYFVFLSQNKISH